MDKHRVEPRCWARTPLRSLKSPITIGYLKSYLTLHGWVVQRLQRINVLLSVIVGLRTKYPHRSCTSCHNGQLIANLEP